jgi:glucan phosphoethanolaminetransferase (alkaline phosphatase superfamily)
MQSLRRFCADLGLWYFGPCLFMALYVLKFGRPASAIAPHFVVVTLPLLALISTRTVLARFTANRNTHAWYAALVTSSLLGALLVYYLLVIIGLKSWGGVVAWNVIPSFFAQASVVTEALGISPTLLFGLLLLVYLLIVASCLRYFKRFDWIEAMARQVSTPMLCISLVAAAGIVTIEGLQLRQGVWIHASEPVSLTLYPAHAGLDLEGFKMNAVAASALDRREDAARKAYAPSAASRNLVLIVVDALRPDHMGIYGYPRHTTPNLARIAKEHPTRIVADVHSTCGDTACAMFSLFSSQSPSDFSFHPFFLHDVLRRNGYRIHLILSGDQTFFYSLKPFYGPVDSFYDGNQARGYYLNDDQAAVDRLAAMPAWDGAPVMFQFRLMSAHILRKRDDGQGMFEPAARYSFTDSRDTGPGGEPLQSAVNFYDNGVVRADAVINDLLNTLQAKGYLKNTLVVITADHGESLGEHGLFHHANSVREELLRVPLLLISYGYPAKELAPSRIFPSQVDIAPTIASELGLPLPDSWVGRPLQEPATAAISYFTEHSDAGLIDRSDPRNVWKYWRDPASGDDHVFNLSADPHENHDLSAETPAPRLSEWRAEVAPEMQASLPVP